MIATKKTGNVVDAGYCIDSHEFPGAGSSPRTGVTFDAAKQACEGRAARLCSGSEWERGCNGKGGTPYPYGADWNAAKCNTQTEDGSERSVAATGSFKACKSAYGIYDMSGNVAEWVQEKVVKGGGANKPDYATRCDYQAGGSSSPFVGFRCCADPLRE